MWRRATQRRGGQARSKVGYRRPRLLTNPLRGSCHESCLAAQHGGVMRIGSKRLQVAEMCSATADSLPALEAAGGPLPPPAAAI